MAELGLARTGSRWPGRGSSPTAPGRSTRAGWTSTTGSWTSCSAAGIDAVRHALPLGPAAGAGGPRRLAGPGHRRALRRLRRGWSHDRLGDRVDIWTTLNEPWCSAFLGYAQRRARARPHGPGGGLRRRPPPAARPRPGGAGAARGRRRAASASPSTSAAVCPADPTAPADARRGPRGRRPAEPALPRPDAARRVPGRRAGGHWPRSPTWRSCATATRRSSARRSTCSGINYYTPRVRGRRRPGAAGEPGLSGQRGRRVPAGAGPRHRRWAGRSSRPA